MPYPYEIQSKSKYYLQDFFQTEDDLKGEGKWVTRGNQYASLKAARKGRSELKKSIGKGAMVRIRKVTIITETIE